MQTDKGQPALERRLRDQRHPSELKAITPMSSIQPEICSLRSITHHKGTTAPGKAGLRRGVFSKESYPKASPATPSPAAGVEGRNDSIWLKFGCASARHTCLPLFPPLILELI